MRDEKEGSKQGQTNKAKQHSTPKAATFPKKNELSRVGLEPTTLYTVDRALYHRAAAAGPKSHMCMYVYCLDYDSEHFPVSGSDVRCSKLLPPVHLVRETRVHVIYHECQFSLILVHVYSLPYSAYKTMCVCLPWKVVCR